MLRYVKPLQPCDCQPGYKHNEDGSMNISGPRVERVVGKVEIVRG